MTHAEVIDGKRDAEVGQPLAEGLAQGGCVARGESRELLEQGIVIPFPAALRQAGLKRNQVVDVQLCRAGGGYVYRVRVLQPGGAVRPMNIPAG